MLPTKAFIIRNPYTRKRCKPIEVSPIKEIDESGCKLYLLKEFPLPEHDNYLRFYDVLVREEDTYKTREEALDALVSYAIYRFNSLLYELDEFE